MPIERLPKIDPGWLPSIEHLNTIIRKLNDVIDAVNILNSQNTDVSDKNNTQTVETNSSERH